MKKPQEQSCEFPFLNYQIPSRISSGGGLSLGLSDASGNQVISKILVGRVPNPEDQSPGAQGAFREGHTAPALPGEAPWAAELTIAARAP